MNDNPPSFLSDLRYLLNKYSREGGSNTPDLVLAKYLMNCLNAFDDAVTARDYHYGIWTFRSRDGGLKVGRNQTSDPDDGEKS